MSLNCVICTNHSFSLLLFNTTKILNTAVSVFMGFSLFCVFGGCFYSELGLVNKNLRWFSFLSCSLSQDRRGDCLAQPGEQRLSFSETQSMACRDKMSSCSNYCRADTCRVRWQRPEKLPPLRSALKNSGQTGKTFCNELKEMWVWKCQKKKTDVK